MCGSCTLPNYPRTFWKEAEVGCKSGIPGLPKAHAWEKVTPELKERLPSQRGLDGEREEARASSRQGLR